MASDRYATIASVLDDPVNRMIVERELRRRKPLKKWLPPPTPVAGLRGFLFLTAREWQKNPRPVVPEAEIQTADHIAHVFESTEGWFVALLDGMEFGPFHNARKAKDEGISLLEDQGWVFHDPPPWNTLESRKRVAFLMGCASHGLQDTLFDSLFLYQIEERDGAGQDFADPGTDGFLVLDEHVRFQPEEDIPMETLLELYAGLEEEITEVEVD